MTDPSATPVVAGLVLAAAIATLALASYQQRRRHASLRAKFIALFIGLAGAELALLPALLAAAFAEMLDLRPEDWNVAVRSRRIANRPSMPWRWTTAANSERWVIARLMPSTATSMMR